jgi:hypothetical protein
MLPQKVKLHIGAHKTATTHLQYSLESIQAQLLQNNITYIPTSLLRDSEFPPYSGRCSWRQKLFKGRPLFERFNTNLKSLSVLSDCLLISEENIMGLSTDLLCPRIYPNFERKSTFISTLSKFCEVELYLSIRPYSDLIPSAYVQCLRSFTFAQNIVEVVDKIIESKEEQYSWFHLVKRIQKIFPNVSLKFWTVDEYQRNSNLIISKICESDVSHIINTVAVPNRTKSPSSEAIEKIIDLKDRNYDDYQYITKVSDIISRDNGKEKYKPLGNEQIEALEARYKKDLDRLCESNRKSWLLSN